MNDDPNITDANFGAGETPEQTKEKVRIHPDNFWTLRNMLILGSMVMSAASVVLALITLNSSISNQRHLISNQREMKGIDLLATFQKRYDELAYDVRSRVNDPTKLVARDSASQSTQFNDSTKTTSEKSKDWYHRFWDLQFEQYQYWKLGYINKDIYVTWMEFRKHEWDTNDSLAGMTYQEGWTETKEHHFGGGSDRGAYYKNFTKFMRDVFDGKTNVYLAGPPQD